MRESALSQRSHEEESGIDDRYQIPDELWSRIRDELPPPPKSKRKDRPGRPREMDDRKAMNAIFYVLRTGCQWKALPRSLGASQYRPRQIPRVEESGILREDMEARSRRV
jgi:transposase